MTAVGVAVRSAGGRPDALAVGVPVGSHGSGVPVRTPMPPKSVRVAVGEMGPSAGLALGAMLPRELAVAVAVRTSMGGSPDGRADAPGPSWARAPARSTAKARSALLRSWGAIASAGSGRECVHELTQSGP